MTFPFYLRIGPAAIHPHWVFETLAYSLAFFLYRRGRARRGDVVDARTRWWIIAAAAVGGLAGSRLLSLLEDPRTLGSRAQDPILLLGEKTIVGGLIGGWMAVEWIKRRRGVTVATGDLLAVPLAVGIAIGRIGCFLSGLDDGSYGIQTRLPWGVDFGDGIARHATQIYEIAFLALLVPLLARLTVPPVPLGDRFKAFMVAYLTFRLALDFIKPAARIGGLSPIQWACAAVIAFYAPHIWRLVTETVRG